MNATLLSEPSSAEFPGWARQAIDRFLRKKLTPLDRLWINPDLVMTAAGMTPDPWQARLLRSTSERVLLLCHRQAGNSEGAAALAVHTALLQPKSLVLLL